MNDPFIKAVEINPGRTYLLMLDSTWHDAPDEQADRLLAALGEEFPGSRFLLLSGVNGIAESSGD